MSIVDDIGHILAGCPHTSPWCYFPLRHDEVAKTFLCSHVKKDSLDKKITLHNESEYMFIYTKKPREYWWIVSTNTATEVPQNKLDLIMGLWNKIVSDSRIYQAASLT